MLSHHLITGGSKEVLLLAVKGFFFTPCMAVKSLEENRALKEDNAQKHLPSNLLPLLKAYRSFLLTHLFHKSDMHSIFPTLLSLDILDIERD